MDFGDAVVLDSARDDTVNTNPAGSAEPSDNSSEYTSGGRSDAAGSTTDEFTIPAVHARSPGSETDTGLLGEVLSGKITRADADTARRGTGY